MPHHPRQQQPKYASPWTLSRIDWRSAAKKVDVAEASVLPALTKDSARFLLHTLCEHTTEMHGQLYAPWWYAGTNWMVFVWIVSPKHIFRGLKQIGFATHTLMAICYPWPSPCLELRILLLLLISTGITLTSFSETCNTILTATS